MVDNRALKVGVIGANWGLTARGPLYEMIPGVKMGAVCTAHRETAEAAAKKAGILKAYWDYHEMIADPEIDIIDIGTKPSMRYDMVMSALKAGKHVYNALPFAMSVEQARNMRDLQRKNGVVGVVDAQFRWVPAIMRMKEMIDEGLPRRSLQLCCQRAFAAGGKGRPAIPAYHVVNPPALPVDC